ncbi:MAG: hypothetical protein KDA56_14210 [Hyphomonas sp.]|nr:hypothetical protein [Hyphomonas sp.]
MMISPVRLSASHGLAWAFAGQQAAALATRLGLGPLGMHAFLPPAACTGLQNPPVTRDLFWTLHDAALSWSPVLDSG